MNENLSSTMSAVIARRRKELGMTQEQLARELGISYQAVSKWENELSSPDISAIPLLADVLGITIGELFGREELEPEPESGMEPETETAIVPAAVTEETWDPALPWSDDGTLRAVLFVGRQLVGSEKIRSGMFARNRICFQYEGPALNIQSAFDVSVDGDVHGSVTADGNVSCDAVGGSVAAGGGVNCDDVAGTVSAGGNVNCDDVKGDVHAGGSVTCDAVEGLVRAGGSVTCDDVTGDVQAGGNVTADSISGDVRAEGEVRIGE